MFQQRISPEKDALFHINNQRDKTGFEIRPINDYIGKGVYTKRVFHHGSFLLEYRGESISDGEAAVRANQLPEGNTFMYFYEHQGIIKCVDATNTDSIAKMVNDGTGSQANAVMKKVMFQGRPCLCLFALRDISKGEQLLYDYGQPNLPWRKQSERTEQNRATSSQALSTKSPTEHDRATSSQVLSTESPVEHDRATSSQVPSTKSPTEHDKASSSQVLSTKSSAVRKNPPRSKSMKKKRKRSSERTEQNRATSSQVLSSKSPTEHDRATSSQVLSTESPVEHDRATSSQVPSTKSPTEHDMASSSQVLSTKSSAVRKNPPRSKSMKTKRKRSSERTEQNRATSSQVLSSKSPTEHDRATSSQVLSTESPVEHDKATSSQVPSTKSPTEHDMASTSQVLSTKSSAVRKNPPRSKSMKTKRKRSKSKSRRAQKVPIDGDSDIAPPTPPPAKKKSKSRRARKVPIDGDSDIAPPTPPPAKKKSKSRRAQKVPSDSDSDMVPPTPPPAKKVLFDIPGTSGLQKKSSQTDSSSESSETSSSSEEEKRGIFIKLSNSKGRKHVCLYCNKMQTKISKHLLRCHSNEADVAKLLALKKGSLERVNSFELLVNKGNFYHNKNVFATKEGEVIPVRRPSFPCDPHLYVPCGSCLGYYPQDELRKHVAYKCIGKLNTQNEQRPSSAEVRIQSEIVGEVFGDKLKHVPQVLGNMRQDNVTMLVRHDKLILQLGEHLCRKLVNKMDAVKRRHYVSQKMRETARLVLEFRKLFKSDASLDDMIHPKQFDFVVESVQKTAGEPDVTDVDADGCKHPSIALKLGHDLRKLTKIKEGLAIKDGDDLKIQEAQQFSTLMDAEWTDLVSTPALSTISSRRYEKVEELPKSEDIGSFSAFLTKEIAEISSVLRKEKIEPRSSLYRRGQNLALAKLTFFNKRRPGEVEQLKLKTFTEAPAYEKEDIEELKASLSPLEKQLCEGYLLLYVRGKRGRKVPLLVPPDCQTLLEILVDLREEAGIKKKNRYFFARFQSLTQIRACDSMRTLTKEANLESPHLLRLTKLRKYISTLSQVLDMKNQHSEWLSDHLGHSLQVHKSHYRLPSGILEKAKIAKLLLAVDAGHVGSCMGKTLEEIDLSDIPTILEELGEVEEEEDEAEEDEAEAAGEAHPRVERTSDQPAPNVESKGTAKEWDPADKKKLFAKFDRHIKRGSLPGKNEILECMRENPSSFVGRSWKNLKDCIRNYIVSLKKQ